MSGSIGRRAASGLVGIATAFLILAAVVALFFNPVYVAFEQDRAEASAWTGYSADEVRAVTDSVLSQIYFGPPAFDQTVGGQSVFDQRERAHLADVRGVLLAFVFVTLLAALLFVGAAIASRASGLEDRRRWLWAAIRRGAGVLAVGIVAGGVASAVAFDAAFDLFHRLFFAGGSYTFDPSSERLVQLFPARFWTETSVALAVVGVVLALGVYAVAGRRMVGRPLVNPAPESPAAGLSAAAKDAR